MYRRGTYSEFEQDKYNRQQCFYDPIEFDRGIHAASLSRRTKCISLMHFYIRKNFIAINVYGRSWNFYKEFDYDIHTFVEIRKWLAKELNLTEGPINVLAFSLHSLSKRGT